MAMLYTMATLALIALCLGQLTKLMDWLLRLMDLSSNKVVHAVSRVVAFGFALMAIAMTFVLPYKAARYGESIDIARDYQPLLGQRVVATGDTSVFDALYDCEFRTCSGQLIRTGGINYGGPIGDAYLAIKRGDVVEFADRPFSKEDPRPWPTIVGHLNLPSGAGRL